LRAKQSKAASVFLNVPYDLRFQPLYLAYIVGVTAFGLVPRATLEIPGGTRRLERIFSLIKSCQYSIHDLSRVQLDRSPPRTPRFNMPFELGLTVAWDSLHQKEHTWFVFESKVRRVAKSLSDLDGTDIYIHGGSIDGVFRELGNAFVRAKSQPSFQAMHRILTDLRNDVPNILRNAGAQSVFEARAFKDICIAASGLTNVHVSRVRALEERERAAYAKQPQRPDELIPWQEAARPRE
jgi:hypothetical protein